MGERHAHDCGKHHCALRDIFPGLDEAKYFSYSGIVGGVASVAGLLALLRPGITSGDLQGIEVNALKSITKISEELKSLEDKKQQTTAEVDGLTIKKREMELLVRKASLALFLKEQLRYHQTKITDIIDSNADLGQYLQEYSNTREKLEALDEEVLSDPNSALLFQVIDAAKWRRSAIDDAISDLPHFTRVFAIAVRDAGRAYGRLLRLR